MNRNEIARLNLGKVSVKSFHLRANCLRANCNIALDTLMRILPNLQHELPPSSILSRHIQLRLLPKTHPSLPSIRGKVGYLASWRLAQWVLPFFVLGPLEGFAEIADGILPDDSANGSKKSAWEKTSKSVLGITDKFTADHKKGSIVFKIMSMRVIDEEAPIDEDVSESTNESGTALESSTKLLVRWQASFAPSAAEVKSSVLRSGSSGSEECQGNAVVVGLFTFEFDKAGKILVHSVDDIQEIRSEEKAVSGKRLKKLAEVVSGNRAAEDDEEGSVVVDEREHAHNVPRHA